MSSMLLPTQDLSLVDSKLSYECNSSFSHFFFKEYYVIHVSYYFSRYKKSYPQYSENHFNVYEITLETNFKSNTVLVIM